MKKIIFVCHGSICRSPAAEFIFRKMIKEQKREKEFSVTSLALTNEKIGNSIYPPMKECLVRNDIPLFPHKAKKITQKDVDDCDYLFYMDNSNKRIISYLIEDGKDKCYPVSFYTLCIDEIEDPWYTDNYDLVVLQLKKCINDILKNI